MEIIKKVNELLESGEKAALATVISTVDSTPGKVGFKMVVTEDGETFGTVGGGCVEAGVWAVAKQVMATGQPEVVNFTLKGDVVSCGGKIKIFVEQI